MPPASPTPLVLLPGMDGTGRLFARLVAVLPEGLEPVVVSYPCDRRLSYAELGEFVRAEVPAGREYALVAESFSGPIAIAHAATRPPNLRAVVLAATFASAPIPRGLRWVRTFVRLAPMRLPRSLVRLLLVGCDAPADLVDDVSAAVAAVRRDLLADRLRQILGVDVRGMLPRIDVPVLCLTATRDRLLGRRALAFGERVSLDGPHLILQRRPAEAAEAIASFLDPRG